MGREKGVDPSRDDMYHDSSFRRNDGTNENEARCQEWQEGEGGM